MAHIFGELDALNHDVFDPIKEGNEKLTPDLLVDADYYRSPIQLDEYRTIKEGGIPQKTRQILLSAGTGLF